MVRDKKLNKEIRTVKKIMVIAFGIFGVEHIQLSLYSIIYECNI